MASPIPRPLKKAEALSLCAALTILAIVLPRSVTLGTIWRSHFEQIPWLNYGRFSDLCLILVGLMLTLPSPRDSGLCIGNIREHWKGVLLLTAGPVLLCAIVYPQLPER